MEQVFTITGGKPLKGKVRISGSKNATLALIPAAVLANEPVRIFGIPKITDVAVLGKLLEELNCDVEYVNGSELIIKPNDMINTPLVSDEVTKLRASYYFMGALLGKYKKVDIRMSGGCDLGPRPIDLHLKGFEALGATVTYTNNIYSLEARELKGTKIFLDIASVGATINIMMAAVYAKGRTSIDNAAKEPEIVDVANLLNKMGAKIRGAGTNYITIDGVDYLGGCCHEIIPDRIEAATYIIAAATAAEDMTIENVIPLHLEALIAKLKEMNVNIEVGSDWVRVRSGKKTIATDIMTLTYPGLATDVQQPFSVLMTQAEGSSQIVETIYVERFKQCHELIKLGADIELKQGLCLINGQTKLIGCDVTATDLRGGVALVIAGLIAEGVTTVHEIYHVDRGYEGIDEKLRALGADIKRTTKD